MLPEYEALRAEINKLSHASRPEVDWLKIHQLASQIFEKQGVDLQTAIYLYLCLLPFEGAGWIYRRMRISCQSDRHPMG